MSINREYNASFDHEAELKMRLIERRIKNEMHKSIKELTDDLHILGNISQTYKTDFNITSNELRFNKYGYITNNPFLRKIDDLKEQLWNLIEKQEENERTT